MNKTTLSQSNPGFTLVELLLVMVFAMVLLLGMIYFYSNHVRRTTELNAKSEAQQQLDQFAQQLQKDFERHAAEDQVLLPTPINQALPAGAPFNAAASGLNCTNVTIQQRVVGVGGAPDVIAKIEYRTTCDGAALPDATVLPMMHPDFGGACTLGPRVTRTSWADQSAGGAGTPQVYPLSPPAVAMSLCFRRFNNAAIPAPPAPQLPTRFVAEISAAYPTSSGSWKALQKTLTLETSQVGGGMEIIPPQ